MMKQQMSTKNLLLLSAIACLLWISQAAGDEIFSSVCHDKTSDMLLSCLPRQVVVIYNATLSVFTGGSVASCESLAGPEVCLHHSRFNYVQEICFGLKSCSISTPSIQALSDLCPGASRSTLTVDYICVTEDDVKPLCGIDTAVPTILTSPNYPNTYPMVGVKEKCVGTLKPVSERERHEYALNITVIDHDIQGNREIRNCRHPAVNRSLGMSSADWDCPLVGSWENLHIVELPVNISLPIASITKGRGVLFHITKIDRIELCVDTYKNGSLVGVIHDPNEDGDMWPRRCSLDINPGGQATVHLRPKYLDPKIVVYSCGRTITIAIRGYSPPNRKCKILKAEEWTSYEWFVEVTYLYSKLPVVIVYQVEIKKPIVKDVETTTQADQSNVNDGKNVTQKPENKNEFPVTAVIIGAGCLYFIIMSLIIILICVYRRRRKRGRGVQVRGEGAVNVPVDLPSGVQEDVQFPEACNGKVLTYEHDERLCPSTKDMMKEDMMKEDMMKEDMMKEDMMKEDMMKEDMMKEDMMKEDMMKDYLDSNNDSDKSAHMAGPMFVNEAFMEYENVSDQTHKAYDNPLYATLDEIAIEAKRQTKAES